MAIKITKMFRCVKSVLNTNLLGVDVEVSCREISEMLECKLKKIPAPNSCVNSRVPEGRTWCDYYNATFAGRCNHSCRGYENKYLIKEKTDFQIVLGVQNA